MASVYENLGKQMVQFDVKHSDLENKINRLTSEGKINDEDARELVTGFVDEAIKTKTAPADIYTLVNGFARWLYNGDFNTVRRRILENMAATGEGIALLEAKKDEQGIQIVAELAWEKNPMLTIRHYKGANRNELLKKIAERHFNSDSIGIPKECFTELNDIPSLRRHALAHLENLDYVRNVLAEHGTDDDYREAVEFFRKRNRSVQHGCGDCMLAYDWATRIKSPTAKDKKIIEDLKAELIKKSPENAISRFWKEDRRYDSWRQEYKERICTDKEGVIAAGKRLLETDKPVDALKAFESVKYEGPEVLKAGIQVIKQYYEKDPSLYHVYERDRPIIQAAAKKAVPAYLAAGGSVLAVESMINENTCGDDLNRRIGEAQTVNNPGSSFAYQRFIAIKKKTPDDYAKIARIRTAIVESDVGSYVFEEYKDTEGMRMLIDKRRVKRPDSAFATALTLKDEKLVEELRQEIVSKTSPDYALRTFTEAKDEKGIQMVRDKIGPGIEPGVIDSLLDRGY